MFLSIEVIALVSGKSQVKHHSKRSNKRVRENRGYKLPLELIRRLGHYVVDHSPLERSEVVEEALDKFLSDKGY